MEWRCARFRFDFPRPALVMGVINVTPDSFSDGGRWFEPEAAVDHALALAAEGADLLDVGGESTRPGAAPVSETEELRRVLPVLQRLVTQVTIPLSIDTQKPVVARAAIEAGATIVNDIAANRNEPTMDDLVAKTGVGYVAMHMQGTPATMQTAPEYRDVRTELKAFFVERLGRLAGAGVAPEQVVLDPGIGFGKSLAHNLDLIAGLSELERIGRPLLLGISRKSFIGKLLGVGVQDRLPAGLACTVWAALQGTQIFRTHDVAATVQALRMTEALREPRPVLP